MFIITKTCNAKDCNRQGTLDKNGRRYLSRGLCTLHYGRFRRGVPIDKPAGRDYRPAVIEGDIAKIPLGVNAKDGYAIVDKEFSWVDKYYWSLATVGYASDPKGILLHHIIKGKAPRGMYIDHINRDKLDNRKINLRIVTAAENSVNYGARNNTKSGHKNISWDSFTSMWRVLFTRDGKIHDLGRFHTITEALKVRDMAIPENER